MTETTRRQLSDARSPRLTRRHLASSTAGALVTTLPPAPRWAGAQAIPDPSAETTAVIDRREMLRSLLSVVPPRLAADEIVVLFFYADLAGQFASLGIDQEQLYRGTFVEKTSDRGLFLAVRMVLPLPSAFDYGQIPKFIDAVGFTPWLIGQTLHVGEPDDHLILLRDGVDLAALPAAWEASGYRRKTLDDGREIWTIGEEGEIDPSRSGGFVGGDFNNATVLDSGVVVFGNLLETVAEAVALGKGVGPSLRDDADLAVAVDGLPESTVGVIGITPRYVSSAADSLMSRIPADQRREIEDGLTEDDELGGMPPWRTMVMGITGGYRDDVVFRGGPDDVPADDYAGSQRIDPAQRAVVARLVAASEEDAAAIAGLVERRWHAWRSIPKHVRLTDLFEVKESGAIGSLAAVDFTPVRAAGIWIETVFQGDLLPFAFELCPGEGESTLSDRGTC